MGETSILKNRPKIALFFAILILIAIIMEGCATIPFPSSIPIPDDFPILGWFL